VLRAHVLTMRSAPFVFAASLVLACSSTPKNTASGPTLGVEVDRVLPLAESLEASAVEVTLALDNPTSKAVEVESVEYEMDTKDVAGVLKGTAKSGAHVEASQRSELKFKQSIPFPADKEAYEAILKEGTIPFDLKGTVRFSNGENVAFSRVGEVATPTLPHFDVNDAQAARYGAEGVDVTFYLRLINDNVFPVMVQNVSYTVFVNDKQIRSESAGAGVRLLAGSAEEYEVSKTIGGNKDFSPEELKQVLAKGELTYRVEGKVELARLTIPFEHSGTIQLATGE
jgi:LEA14-like dessication related protein